MRKPKHISPSAYMLWKKDKEEYAMRNLVDKRPPRSEQIMAASVGSSFDAYVKSNLHADLFGVNADPKFGFDALFEEQVEPHNRDDALAMGDYCFHNYIASGAYDDLLELMGKADEDPQFEFTALADVKGVPLLGKPDCKFIIDSLRIVLDWKVRNFCSKYSASPMKGFSLCRDCLGWPKPSKSNGKSHKLYEGFMFNGLEIDKNYMEDHDRDWAVQLSMYGWMMGEAVGDEDVVVCIDELVSKSRLEKNSLPLLRVANHRARVSKVFQEDLFANIKNMWDSIQEGHVFVELSRKESDEKFQAVNQRAIGLSLGGSWMSKNAAPAYRK